MQRPAMIARQVCARRVASGVVTVGAQVGRCKGIPVWWRHMVAA